MRISDWSSDVCSSDLIDAAQGFDRFVDEPARGARLHQIGIDVERLDAEFLFNAGTFFFNGIGIAKAVDHHIGAFGGQPACNGHANATCGARDYRVFTFRSEEHTSELQSLMPISYAVFCLQK